jgi:DNA-binding CsgD family transcriptional regulator
MHTGEFAAAAALLTEAEAINQVTGTVPLRYTSLMLAAWPGREAQTVELMEASLHDATTRGEGRVIVLAEYSTAVLDNGLCRYEAALAAAQRACAYDIPGLFGFALVELAEASTRSDRPELAADAVRGLGEHTRASGTQWALGILTRTRALRSHGPVAEALYREARDRLAPHPRRRASGPSPPALRGMDAPGEPPDRRPGPAAHRQRHFRAHRGRGVAERTRRELLATGVTVRRHAVGTLDELTAQEVQIARLARDGHTNPEIGAELFLSPRTVEWHLGKATHRA